MCSLNAKMLRVTAKMGRDAAHAIAPVDWRQLTLHVYFYWLRERLKLQRGHRISGRECGQQTRVLARRDHQVRGDRPSAIEVVAEDALLNCKTEDVGLGHTRRRSRIVE